MSHAAAEGPTDPHTVLHNYRKLLAALVGKVPEQSGIAARGVEIPKNPAVPTDAGKRGSGVLGRPTLGSGAKGGPPIVALESFLRIARVDDDPARGARAKAAVESPIKRLYDPGAPLWLV